MEHPALVHRLIESGQRPFDSSAIRTWLADPEGLPRGMALLFSGAPVDDHRLFIVHNEIVESLAHGLESGAPMTALISGARGSGRTSLVNMIQLRTRSLRILRPDDGFHDRRSGVLGALASELSCIGSSQTLNAELSREPTLVLLDNLERFVMPTPAGLKAFQEALHGMATGATRAGAAAASGAAARERTCRLRRAVRRRLIILWL